METLETLDFFCGGGRGSLLFHWQLQGLIPARIVGKLTAQFSPLF